MQFITNAILREFGSFSKEIAAKTKAILWIAAKTSWHQIGNGKLCSMHRLNVNNGRKIFVFVKRKQ
jgi:hypothetical protein